MEKLLEGKTLSQKILSALPARITAVAAKAGRPPKLAIVNYFDDSPSGIYVKRKVAACEKLGVAVRMIKPEPKDGLSGFLKLLADLKDDGSVDAVMIERPLPDGFEVPAMWDAIAPEKDVDALSSVNMGRLFISKTRDPEHAGFFTPCTALAVVRLLKHHNIEVAGKKIAVAGRSAVVGRPLAHMLTSMDATVTLCHTRTPDIAGIFKASDLIVTAAGKARWLTAEMIAPEAVVIDVGTNIDENGRMCGDADFEGMKDLVRAMTPVPGGVGPVTMACLIEASVKAAETRI
ncbi:MAG: bifunctional 5,10-methylenetetrahydrofolate dehydrogenase/5,10-methenyltetrahydrofolate cyclohydrolase [Elusimicrobiales bacterium]|jgi:methylenetetrahydrofolate dehydrogenase (NADP+)/methenyltetrahydrofolate cyclohydrolase